MSRQLTRSLGAFVVALIAGASVAACGGSKSTSTTAGAKTGTIQMVMGTAPQSLDPGLDNSTQGGEANWLVYTGLTTYRHASGTAGTQLIPGLATALPKITDNGKTYTVTLRKGLVFSNGTPVKASDFTYTVERAIKIPWGSTGSFIEPIIVGATAYANNKAKTISGITTNDATGEIVIHLTAAYGPFANVLAFPVLGIIPTGTPMKAEPTSPPAGVGPYMVTNIVPNQSFDVVKNPQWSKMNIPGIPAGYENFEIKVNANVAANALSVLSNSTDMMDWADTIPGSLVPQITHQAAGRFKLVDLGGSTYYIFMNPNKAPFSSLKVRQAVVTALSYNAINRLGSGTLDPGCWFLPPDVPGHPSSSAKCPYGTPGDGNLAKAKQLIAESGMAGQSVTVWSEMRSPRLQWMTYYTSLLNEIGLKATLKEVSDANYWTTIGEAKTLAPQTGFADYNQDFPNPDDFYGGLLIGSAIEPTNNWNFGQVNDPHVNAVVAQIGGEATANLDQVRGQWEQLEQYVAQKAYVAVLGYERFPFFTSDRVTYGAGAINSIYGWDLTQLQLK